MTTECDHEDVFNGVCVWCRVEVVGTADPQCPNKTPEPHLRGEFPMTCYRCHIEADS